MPVDTITFDGSIYYGEAVTRAAGVLNDGGVVVFPTETVYGVGARADLPDAVARLRRLKDRADGKPFTVHIPHREAARAYVPAPAGPARRLMEKGWPGPLTLLVQVEDPAAAPVLRGRNGRLASEIYHEGQVGLRCPDHVLAAGMLAGAAGPVVAASANRAGAVPPRTAAEAAAELGEDVDLLIDGGRAQFARASTIVRLSGRQYEIIREGVYDERTVRRLACMNILMVCSGNTCRSPMAAAICEKMLCEKLGCSSAELPAHDVVVRSAGASAVNGGRATGEAVEVLRRRGIDLSHHCSMSLTPELIHQADRIYVMTRSHAETVATMAPAAAGKTCLLGGEAEIDDPHGKGTTDYEVCATRIQGALAERLKEVEP